MGSMSQPSTDLVIYAYLTARLSISPMRRRMPITRSTRLLPQAGLLRALSAYHHAVAQHLSYSVLHRHSRMCGAPT